jgi:hypothetical protein
LENATLAKRRNLTSEFSEVISREYCLGNTDINRRDGPQASRLQRRIVLMLSFCSQFELCRRTPKFVSKNFKAALPMYSCSLARSTPGASMQDSG